MPKIYVVILNYNSAETIISCLRCVFSSRNVDITVVVVDNGSTDDSFIRAKTLFPRVEYLKNVENIGFSAGNNIGIRFALERGADYVVLINSDAIITPDTLAHLVTTAEKLRTPSILCPKITDTTGAIWYAGAHINWRAMRITHNHKPQRTNAIVPTDSATGCVMSIHKDVFKKIGLLNESYFLYYEDADFSYCARRAGFTVGVVPRAHAVHHEVSETPARKPLKTYWLVLSALLFFTAHAPLHYRIFYRILIPLRRLKNRIAPSDKNTAPHVRRAFTDFPAAKKHYVRHY